MLIGILGWVICGVIIAFFASKLTNLHGDDPRLGLAMGGAGGLIGGWLFSLFSGSPVTVFNAWSLLVAGVVALAAAAAWFYVRSRGTHEKPSFRRSY